MILLYYIKFLSRLRNAQRMLGVVFLYFSSHHKCDLYGVCAVNKIVELQKYLKKYLIEIYFTSTRYTFQCLKTCSLEINIWCWYTYLKVQNHRQNQNFKKSSSALTLNATYRK